MTPKEKAIELVNKYVALSIDFFNGDSINRAWAKQCASLVVDEIINTLKIFPEKDTTSKSVVNFSVSRIMYWVTVKQEIEKL
jgi:hypothetical protein